MPAKSKAQQKAAGAALSAKRGETKPSELYGSSKDMYDSMSEEELEEFASTTRKGKPEKKDDYSTSFRPTKTPASNKLAFLQRLAVSRQNALCQCTLRQY